MTDSEFRIPEFRNSQQFGMFYGQIGMFHGQTCSAAAARRRKRVERIRVSTGTKWEPIVGYSRAIRVRNHIYVSGTTATDERGELVGEGDAYAQTVRALRNVENALQELGASLEQVVRTRMFVTDMSRWEEYGRAHGDFFRDVRPATTMVEVKRLILPQMLIEIEADAEL